MHHITHALRATFKVISGQQLKLVAHGRNDVDEMKETFEDGAVMYGYVREILGSDCRSKFAFISWVGEGVRPMQRARAFEDTRVAQQTIRVGRE